MTEPLLAASPLAYDVSGPVARLTLNRPRKLNALDHALVAAIRDGLRRAQDDADVRVVILTGAGGNFSAGYDLAEEVADELDTAGKWYDVLADDIRTTMAVLECQKPVIAAVEGHCLAGGAELALACDLVVASETARIGEPEIRYGSGPVTLLLPFQAGIKKAAELLFTGDVLNAEQAREAGLVNTVVPAGEALAHAEALALRIAPTPAPVLRFTKLALLRTYEAMGLREAVLHNLPLSALLNAADTPEQREFDAIVAERGLRAALDWRDERYGEKLRGG